MFVKSFGTVTVRKLRACDNPEARTPDPDEDFHENPNCSMPVDFSITGSLLVEVESGHSVMVLHDGKVFGTTPIQEMAPREGGLILYTKNSVYELDFLDKQETVDKGAN